jgi:hypothetical protein
MLNNDINEFITLLKVFCFKLTTNLYEIYPLTCWIHVVDLPSFEFDCFFLRRTKKVKVLSLANR